MKFPRHVSSGEYTPILDAFSVTNRDRRTETQDTREKERRVNVSGQLSRKIPERFSTTYGSWPWNGGTKGDGRW